MTRQETLQSALLAVTQDRQATHGRPERSFEVIAGLWSVLLGQTITPAQAALMMASLKVARAWDNPAHGDNWTDLAGYAACGAELAGAQ